MPGKLSTFYKKKMQEIESRRKQLPQLNAPEEPRHEAVAEAEGKQIIS